MTTRSRFSAAVTRAVVITALASAGCSELQPVFPPPESPLYWPASFDPPRFEYVGELRGEADLKKPRSFWQAFADFWAGAEEPSTIQAAHGVIVNPPGVVWVSDPDAHCVHRFDLETREYRRIVAAGEELRFGVPIGLARLRDRVLVADRALQVVAVLSADGDPLGILGDGVLLAPVGLAVGPRTGRIYVADVGAHEIRVLDPDGSLLLRFGGRGDASGRFNYPTHIACDSEEKLYVSDTLNSRIQLFDREGRFLGSWGKREDTPGNFAQPKGVACSRRDHIYVVDSRFENFQVFQPDGRLLLAVGEEGEKPGEFTLPIGIFAADDDTIWVADAYNHRVQVFRYLAPETVPTEP